MTAQGITSSHIRHMCPEEGPWCQFVSNPEGYKHKHGLPAAVVELTEPICIDLSSPDLLSKCLHGKTQNNNECLNKLIWDMCKRGVCWEGDHWRGSILCCEVVQWWKSVCCETVWKLWYCSRQIYSWECEHIRQTKALQGSKSSDVAKTRKAPQAQRKGFQDKTSETEGSLYEKEGHWIHAMKLWAKSDKICGWQADVKLSGAFSQK